MNKNVKISFQPKSEADVFNSVSKKTGKQCTTVITNASISIDCNNFFIFKSFEGKGVAVLSEGDEYDEKTGRRIAYTKAENCILKQIRAFLAELCEETLNVNGEMLGLTHSIEDTLMHNKEYLIKLSVIGD